MPSSPIDGSDDGECAREPSDGRFGRYQTEPTPGLKSNAGLLSAAAAHHVWPFAADRRRAAIRPAYRLIAAWVFMIAMGAAVSWRLSAGVVGDIALLIEAMQLAARQQTLRGCSIAAHPGPTSTSPCAAASGSRRRRPAAAR